MISLENLARSILMPERPVEPEQPSLYDEVHFLRAENARLKQENARRRLKLREARIELGKLKENK